MVPSGKLLSVSGPEVQIDPTCVGSCFFAQGLQYSWCHPGEGPLEDDIFILFLAYDQRRGESP